MIASLEGKVEEKNIDHIILNVNGIGYLINISNIDYEHIKTDSNAKVFIHENIKEDAYDLYGFIDRSTKILFNQLISVKNVGPKVALSILSLADANTIRARIADGDVAYLKAAKGVGKRAAEQVVVELRDKVGLVSGEGAQNVLTRKGVSEDDDAMQALISLGYTQADAINALSRIDNSLPSDERVKLALKGGN